MTWLDRIVGKPETRSGLANPDAWLVDTLTAGSQTYSGQAVSFDKAMCLTAFRSAITLISETVGLLPFKVFRDVDGDKFPQPNHRAWRMLHDRPNPSTSAHRFWSTAAGHIRVHGNAYIEKLRGPSGLVEELWLRDPRYMHVEWRDGLKQKTFWEESGPYGQRRQWDEERMLHITGWSLDGLTGESILWRGRNTIGNAIAREEFEGNFFRRGATLASVIEHPGRLGDTAAKRLRDYFAERYGGGKNAHKTPVLEEGATLRTVSPNLVDLDFEAAQIRTRTEIAVMLGIPPSFLGGSTGDSLTYATVEANMIQFMQHAIAPITSAIEHAVSADPSLFPFASWFGEFDLNGMLRGDSTSRAAFYKTMSEIGALTVDEIRAMENRPPLDELPPVDETMPAPPPGDALGAEETETEGVV